MKKTLLIVFTVLALVLATILADRATRVRQKADNIVAKTDSASMGLPEPELTLKDLDDKDISLSQYKGKVVLVNFWATWCEACKAEIPWLIEMHKKYGQKGLVILGVSMDDEGKSVVAPFVEKTRWDVNGQKLPMNYRIVIGNEDAADKFGGLLGYPTSILISRDGKQIKRITGLINYEEIANAVESQL
jgi:cytochrome c biogenesis protein CcmG/thiol:disulfide interchange protein DsbE